MPMPMMMAPGGAKGKDGKPQMVPMPYMMPHPGMMPCPPPQPEAAKQSMKDAQEMLQNVRGRAGRSPARAAGASRGFA